MWLPVQGVKLSTSPGEFPWWSGAHLIELANLRPSYAIEYKYVIVRESDGAAKEWEPFDGNRVNGDLKETREVTIEDVFGQKAHIKTSPPKHEG